MSIRLHILGHPSLPLDLAAHPEDSQLFNCWNFCQLAEMLGMDYAYYGLTGSALPPGTHGTVVELGKATCRWSFRNQWHLTYTKRLDEALKKHLNDDGGPEWLFSIYGVAQCDLAAVPPGLPVCEPMLGYGTCWTHYRVFPSYAHQSFIYTRQPETRKDRFFDAVIPHFVNPEDYPPGLPESKRHGLLYLGRDAADKGVSIAREVAAAAGMPFQAVFHGVGGADKARLLGEAKAVLMPTLYLEPFGYVAIEAMLCGTPVIATDWGSFPEIVEEGVNGFRCRTQAEFVRAAEMCNSLDRRKIRDNAVRRFSVAAVAPRYRAYLDYIWNIHRNGGYYAPGALHCPSEFNPTRSC
ncbi:MAG: glycosyltransferase [Victivallales bacterium]|nr:glycosyltransferase [Victivallales bacterium]